MGSTFLKGGEGSGIASSTDDTGASANPAGTAGAAPDLSLVLVVAASPINRIVVSRIVQAAGLKAAACEPGAADEAMERMRPCLVVLDLEADGACAALLPVLAGRRGHSPRNLPLLVALAGAIDTEAPDITSHADAVVARPITPEGLQPVVESLVARLRLRGGS